MLCVFSAVSGEALASLDVEASEAEHQVRRLKARLAKQLGVSRFRQRWLGEDHSELPDDAMLDFSAQNVPVLNVQLVILEFVEAAEQSDQLVSACDKNCWEEVEALLCTPLSPTSFRDQLGRPALHAAARNGHWQCIRLLLEADAEKDEAILGLTALHLAAQRGHVGVVRLLLEAACDLHLVTLKQHETALHLAADHGHPEVVALLLEMKAEKDQARSRDGKTPCTSPLRRVTQRCFDFYWLRVRRKRKSLRMARQLYSWQLRATGRREENPLERQRLGGKRWHDC